MREVQLLTLEDVLAFVFRHGEVAGWTHGFHDKDVKKKAADWEWRQYGRTTAWFADGARLEVTTDMELDYSEMTPGRGFAIEFVGYEE